MFKEKLKEKLKEIENEKTKIMLMSKVAEKKKDKNERFPTGIGLFDEYTKKNKNDTGGIAEGEIMIISAPTGNGKTLLSSTIACNMIEFGIPTLYFSYEITIPMLWESFKDMGAKDEYMAYCPLENSTGNIDWIEKKIDEGIEKFNTKLVIIDHLGFLVPKMSISVSQNYSSYITQIVRELKTIAIKKKIMIILPAHMVKSATDDPTIRDIGHSGGIAQEADFVILLARKENQSESGDAYSKYTKIKIVKNRPFGKTPTGWLTKQNGKLIETFKPRNEDEYF